MSRLLAAVVFAGLMLSAMPSIANAYDISGKTVVDLRDDLAAGRTTAAEVRRLYTERIARLNPSLRAVIAVDPAAPRRGRGPLAGVPILIKDNIETRGPLPTTAGSLALADNVTDRDAPVVAKLRSAGAVILGKANLSEWANIRSTKSISGWSAVGGQARNPYDITRSPCGSSAGSAVAVAAGMAPAAIGTETDGSITCPASVNGLVGLKPTVGLVSRTHIVPISHTQDTPGPITTTVRDAALILQAIAGPDPSDAATLARPPAPDYAAALKSNALRGARIGVLALPSKVDAGTRAVFAHALETLRARGATLVDIAAFPRLNEISELETLALRTELKADMADYLATTDGRRVPSRTLADLIAFNTAHADRELALFDQDLFELSQATNGLNDPAYLMAKTDAHRLAGPEGIDALLAKDNLTALVSLTVGPACLIDPDPNSHYTGGRLGGPAAVAGYPHLTVPMGNVKGLPVGLSFVGPAWSEARLLGYGYAYEQASHARRPPKL